MPVYMIVDLRYDSLEWASAYRRAVPAMVEKWGGRYIAQSFPPERLEGEGELPDSLTILEYPSAEAARGMMSSPEYAPFADARRQQTHGAIYLVESRG
jgi:uncharacterized protein (DUF1330 family)